MENGELLGGRYRILGELGQGGMAVVYQAEDTVLKRLVAIKVLREQYAADSAFLGRFQQEARAAAGLSHPNIVSIYDLGDRAGRPYIVMEYLQGTMLKELVRERGPLSLSQALSVGIQVASGLEYAHRRGIIHRDVKPQNIIVLAPDQPGGFPYSGEELRVKIMDFGIARALGEASFSTTGEVLGSAHYFSPEQAQGQPVTASTDIYSLGVVLYEMLTGRVPFEGDSQIAIALKHVQETPPLPRELNPRIPPAVEALVLRALEKEPSRRFSSAGELEAALRRYRQLGEEPTGVYQPVAPTSIPAPSGGKLQSSMITTAGVPRRRARWLLALLTTLSLAWLAGLGVVATQTFQALVPVPKPTILPAPSPAPTPTLAMVLVPGLVNLDTALARAVVEERGLRYEELSAEFSQAVPAGKIIRQTPSMGTTLAQGAVVSVVVSRGPPKANLPSVVGLNYTEAEALLKNAGFGVARQEEWSQQVPKGAVISQAPLSGGQEVLGTVVTLVVSKGWMRPVVPNVVGRLEAEAKQIIAEAGYRTAPYVNRQGHDVLPDEVLRRVCIGCVLSTTPVGGTEAAPGTEVFMAVRKD